METYSIKICFDTHYEEYTCECEDRMDAICEADDIVNEKYTINGHLIKNVIVERI